MRRGPGWMLILAVLALTTVGCGADDQGPARPPALTDLHLGLRAAGAEIQKIAFGFRFTEGPAADEAGNVYFSDIPNQRIHVLDWRTGEVRVLFPDSGRANGLMLDAEGRLVACEGGRRRLVRYEDAEATVLAERWDGKRLNSPNDLDIDATGGIYFSDPRYGKQDGRELDEECVYYRAFDGVISRVVDDLEKPNGVLLANDGRLLYVAASKRKRIYAYPVREPGVLGPGREFSRLDDDARGGPDGMTSDVYGNVYAAGQHHVWIWAPDGHLIEKIRFPEAPANCAFGGADRMTLFVTARTSLYSLAMRVAGRPLTR